MTPTSEPRPCALLQPSRCAAPLRGRLPQSAGSGLAGSSESQASEHGGHPSTTNPIFPGPATVSPGSLRLGSVTTCQNQPSNANPNLLKIDKTYVFGDKSKSIGFHLKPIRETVQAPRPEQSSCEDTDQGVPNLTMHRLNVLAIRDCPKTLFAERQ